MRKKERCGGGRKEREEERIMGEERGEQCKQSMEDGSKDNNNKVCNSACEVAMKTGGEHAMRTVM